MDYAIIELSGKQYRVEKGDSVLVDRLDAKQGAKIAPRALLWRSDGKTVIEGPELEKVKVEAVVAEHLKGEKIRVFKYRPKKRYRRRAGHRSQLTRIEIKEIKGPSAGKPGPGSAEGRKSAEPKQATESRKKPATAVAQKAEAKSAPAKKKETAGGSPSRKGTGAKPSTKSKASKEG
jgi:large subunit ribosomal protein L21